MNPQMQIYVAQQISDQLKADRLFERYSVFNLDYFEEKRIFSQLPASPSKNFLKSLHTRKNFLTRKYRIAVIVPVRTASIDQVTLGFIQSLKEIENVTFTPYIYNAEGSTSFIHFYILRDLLLYNYDLVFTVGMECTKAVSKFFQAYKVKTPVIFVGIHNPHELGFDANYVTGVSSKYSSDDYVNALCAVKPDMKKVGILYNPLECGGATDFFKEGIVNRLNEKNILSIPSGLIKSKAISYQADALIRQVDTLVLLPGNMLSRATKELSEKCNKAKVTLCASYPYDSQNGAALSFGYSDYITGKTAAQKAAAILRDQQPVSTIPINPPDTTYQILINSQTQEKQGLSLDLSCRLFTQRGFSL